MNLIHVQTPGMFTTVQDLGRYGYGPLGVSPSGGADPIALRIGNALVGNSETAAALEMTLLGGTFLFPDGAVVALAGSDFGPDVDGIALPMWTAPSDHPPRACTPPSIFPRRPVLREPQRRAMLPLRRRRNRGAAPARQRFDPYPDRPRWIRRTSN